MAGRANFNCGVATISIAAFNPANACGFVRLARIFADWSNDYKHLGRGISCNLVVLEKVQ
ncbi:MAG TPA: hypothetical protein VFX02_10050 [Gammaproteobacteria bacterium]|nr:hypothetical protein [Gammaproteobacteria bacterium]